MVARLEPYRPREPGWHWHLGGVRQVAGRIVGPEPSAPLWIRVPLLWTSADFSVKPLEDHAWRTRSSNTMTDDALLAAYRRTRFCADTDHGSLVIRVGERCAELDALLTAGGLTTWAYITAFNPGSVRLSDTENAGRHRALEEAVRQLGCPMLSGEGIGDDGAWPAERSLLVLGIDRTTAVQIGHRFGQRAIVWGELGGSAGLVLCE